MSQAKHTHAQYKLLILTFSIFSLGQFITGALIYFSKVGFGYTETLSYYQGRAIIELPVDTIQSRDEVAPSLPITPRSFYGLVEVSASHTVAYALLCFILSHFLRSLSANARWSNVLSLLLFCFAILDILSTFGARYGATYMSFVRLVILYTFVSLGILSSLALFFLPLRTKISKLLQS